MLIATLVALVVVALLLVVLQDVVPEQRRPAAIFWTMLGIAVVSWSTYGVHAVRGEGRELVNVISPVTLSGAVVFALLDWKWGRV
jgi:hypothetical protein